jgi:RNA polymerase sigma-70 factor (ECF subfamily)
VSLVPGIDVAALAAEHHGSIYRAAYRLCGSVVEAEDLTQQTFLTAHRRRDQLRDPEAARAWLGAILRSCFLKSIRRRRPAAAGDLGVDFEALPGPIPEPSTVDAERLQRALHELGPDARLILTMFYFDELSYREIADELELPPGTVMSRLSRAKEQLRRRLRDSTEAVPVVLRFEDLRTPRARV